LTGVSTETAARWQRFANAGALPYPHVVRTRQPLFISSAEEYGKAFPALASTFAEYGFQASAILPLIAEGRVLGAMTCEFAEPRTFDDDERATLITLAQQTALALDHAQRFDEERQARRAAEQANRAKSNFLAVVSHELRTPLNTISGYIDLMLTGVDGPLPDLYARYAERMRAAQKHVVSLIDSVLRFARVEAGQVSYAVASHNVLDLLRALEPLVEPQIRSRGITFVLTPCELSVRVRADREKVIQILLNLISNAIKNTGAGGKIVIAASQDGPAVTIRVSDTGRGIPAEALDRIFEPFVQIDPDSNETEGLGLGLAISRDLARGMNGDLEARSTVGQGSHFTLNLPAA
jgi:signal transduction histidine kinase